jgi:hypothetical protein
MDILVYVEKEVYLAYRENLDDKVSYYGIYTNSVTSCLWFKVFLDYKELKEIMDCRDFLV